MKKFLVLSLAVVLLLGNSLGVQLKLKSTLQK